MIANLNSSQLKVTNKSTWYVSFTYSIDIKCLKNLICFNISFQFHNIGANFGQDATLSSLCKFAKIPIAQIHSTLMAINFA